ncbi:hypothetical protein [Bradyrhizobium sp. B117]|uniref:hypothetical protein n=1 Tax=Bradyrhizobium sp. B117 TaxID=3140246 RepID=UPI003183CB4B
MKRFDLPESPPRTNYDERGLIIKNTILYCIAIKLCGAFAQNLTTANCQKNIQAVKSGSAPLVPLLAILLFAGAVSALAQSAIPSAECSKSVATSQTGTCSDPAVDVLRRNSQTYPLSGGWQLAKTRVSAGGPETTALIHTADTTKSDFALAGLTLRCNSDHYDVLIILVEALQKADRPKVVVVAGSNRTELVSSAVQNGEALLLPDAVISLVEGAWQQTTALSVEIASSPPISGTIPIAGLAEAVRHLKASCTLDR